MTLIAAWIAPGYACRWKDALDRISPLCVRVRTSNHLDKLAVSKFAISELEVAGGQIGVSRPCTCMPLKQLQLCARPFKLHPAALKVLLACSLFI